MPAARLHQRLRTNKPNANGALLPYFTAGFPDDATTSELIRRADAAGVAAIEVGVPYSDSIADGPVIQESFNYVLQRGHRLEDTFNLVSGVRSSVECALLAMVSYSIVQRMGVDAFMLRAAEAGFDGVILPDVPVEESGDARSAAERADMCYVGLVAPTTMLSRSEEIARNSTGFIYRIAVAGTTGERSTLPAGLPEEVAQLRQISGLPVCVGFGIGTAQQVRTVCSFADGAIVGSAVVRRIADALAAGLTPDAVADSVSRFLGELMTGLTASDG